MPFLSQIFTYPIKSCGAIAHQHIQLDSYGLAWDRRWMIVDPDGMFLTQREFPALAIIQPEITDQDLRLAAPNMPELCVPLKSAHRLSRHVTVWKDTCNALDEGDLPAAWLSDYLHESVRLVRMAADYSRPVNPEYAPRPTETSFTDGYPILILSEGSVAELNRRLVERGSSAITLNRFRPNLVIADCEAFAEDSWKTIQIGEMIIDVVKPCGRCVVTTVDQQTGIIPDTAEPLATLNTFRKQGNKTLFAQNAIHRTAGSLSVQDGMKILSAL